MGSREIHCGKFPICSLYDQFFECRTINVCVFSHLFTTNSSKNVITEEGFQVHYRPVESVAQLVVIKLNLFNRYWIFRKH